MKSLDIDTASTPLNTDNSRSVTIEFTGGIQSGKLYHGSSQAVTVPYSSFATRLKAIQRLGGKIVKISIHDFRLQKPNARHVFSANPIAEVQETLPEITQETVAQSESKAIAEESPDISNLESSELAVTEVSEEISELTSEVAEVSENAISSEIITETLSDIVPESEVSDTIPEIALISDTIPEAIPEAVSDYISEPEDVEGSETAPTSKVEGTVILEVTAALEPVIETVPEVLLETVSASTTIAEAPEVAEVVKSDPLTVEPVVTSEITETTSILDVAIPATSATPVTKKKKAATETVIKTKKPKASKSSQGFSRKVKNQDSELVSVSEAIEMRHLNAEPILVEEVAEHIHPESPVVPVVAETIQKLVVEPEPLVLVVEPAIAVAEVALDLPVNKPKSRKKKSVTESDAKPRKSRTSTKSSLNQQEPHVAVLEPVEEEHQNVPTDLISEVAIAPEVHVPEVIAEPIAIASTLETEPEVVSDIGNTNASILETEPEVVSDIGNTKPPKSKTTTKSGGGFNKPKKSTKKS